MGLRAALIHKSFVGIALAAIAVASSIVPTNAVAQNSARARVSVTVIQGARAMTDSVIRREFRLFLSSQVGLARLARSRGPSGPILPGRGPEGLIAVRIRSDTASRSIKMDVEYVGTD